jgi:hypothetical protein
MASGPPPPADLDTRTLPVVELSVDEQLVRAYKLKNTPEFYDRTSRSRFAAPDGEFGVMYAARRAHGAFAETLLRVPGLVQVSDLQARGFAFFRLLRALRLAQLCGRGLAPLGATAEVTSTADYGLSQRWALALWAHHDHVDGIAYMSRHDNHEWCYALFDRAAPKLGLARRQAMIDNLALMADILKHYRVSLI